MQPAQPPHGTGEATLQKAGLGEALAGLLAEMYDKMNAGRFVYVDIDKGRVGKRDQSEVVGSWLASAASTTQPIDRRSA